MSERLTCTACGAEVEIGAQTPDGPPECPECGEKLYRKAAVAQTASEAPADASVPAQAKADPSDQKPERLNLRFSDNCLQAVCIMVTLIIGGNIGMVMGGGRGAVVGAFAGVVVGLLFSGTVLMIYHAVRRWKSKRD